MSVFDIARSGLRSFQTALEVTATNIANVNTVGYARQDVRMTELRQGTAGTAAASGLGGGVAVADVTRAFSTLLADRTRAAVSTQSAAAQRVAIADTLEGYFTPGAGGIDAGMSAFYTAVSDLSAAPASLPLRQVVLQSAAGLAGRIADTALGLADMRAAIGTAAGLAAGAAQAALEGLAEINADLGRMAPGSTAANALGSARDRLLAELATQIGISTTIDSRGRAGIALAGSGAPLLGPEGPTGLAHSLTDRLELDLTLPDGTARRVALLSGGVLGGLSDALGMLDAAAAELDDFAARVAGAANAMQAAGADLEGNPGQPMFAMTDGAASLSLSLTAPGLIAAARQTVVLPAATNTGTGSATMASVAAAPELAGLAGLLGGGAAAYTPLAAGMIGTLPAQGGTLSLQSLGQPARATFAAPGLTDATALVLETPAGVQTFDLTTLADGTPRPAGWSESQIAAALNDGRLLAAGGATLAGLGGQAAGETGQLQLALDGDLAGARLTGPTLDLAAALDPREAAGGTVQVFTRNGVHLAGTPLTAAEASVWLTEANGFLPGARYDASALNAGYRGLTVAAGQVPGLQAATLAAGGLAAPAGAAPERQITLSMAGVGNAALTLPAGTSAADAAARLTGALPGLAATASTAVALSVADGQVSFTLTGQNVSPVTIAADVVGGDLAGLAARITATGAATGLRAELSPDGSGLMIVSDSGATIGIAGYSHGTGAPLTLTETAPDGTPLGGIATLTATQPTARIAGQVVLSAATGFGLAADGGATVASVADPARGGLFARTTERAGALVRLAPVFDPAVDAASGGTGTAYASGTGYQVTLGGATARVTAAEGAATAGDIALALAGKLRAGTPDATLTGAALATLPAEGATLDLIADGLRYTLSMQAGQPVVTGPEAGRIGAAFGPDNRLTLTLTGSADGSGIRLAEATAGAAFGLAGTAAVHELRGQAVDPAALPAGGAPLTVRIGGTAHVLSVTASGGDIAVNASPDFPGTATVGADGAIRLTLPGDAGEVRIDAAPAAGFATLGASLGVDDGALVVQGGDGPPALGFTAESLASQRLALDSLPDEALLIGMTGSGALGMAGAATAGTSASGTVALEILDAATGEVALSDMTTGDRIASGFLDAEGRVTLAGLAIAVTPGTATGDRFMLTAAGAGSSDGGNLTDLLDLWSGAGGLTESLALLVSDIGSQTAATATAEATAADRLEAARTTEAELSAVDLDTEAARLLALQQAYQGNAKALTVARDLFDTLLKAT